jgi:putative hemolysin
MIMRHSVIIPVLVAAMLLLVLVPPGAAMKDPSAVYCQAMGYIYEIVQTPDGPAGACRMPDGTTIDSWKFLQGTEGRQYSYCAQQGYPQRAVQSYRTCGKFGLDECLVCVLPDGSTAEVTSVMNLSFAETTCGDGSCGSPESVISCPADCKSGGWDNLCDGRRDGRCDPDCPDGAGDPDCGGGRQPDYVMIAMIIGVVLVVATGAFLYLKKKKSP